ARPAPAGAPGRPRAARRGRPWAGSTLPAGRSRSLARFDDDGEGQRRAGADERQLAAAADAVGTEPLGETRRMGGGDVVEHDENVAGEQTRLGGGRAGRD